MDEEESDNENDSEENDESLQVNEFIDCEAEDSEADEEYADEVNDDEQIDEEEIESGQPIDQGDHSDELTSQNDKPTTVKDFIDDEAELSGSEASEDEAEDDDEDELIDDIPDDQVNEKEVIKQNQKLLQKQLLDEDKRLEYEIKERYLLDGELHSENRRERKFRWKNVETAWLDDVYDSSSASGSDDENEQTFQFKIKRNNPPPPLVPRPPVDEVSLFAQLSYFNCHHLLL